MIKPNYMIPAGICLTNQGRSRTLYPNGDGSWRSEDHSTGAVEIICYNQAISALRQPGTSAANMLISNSGAAARIRQGGLHYRDQLCEASQDALDFWLALCVGMDHLAASGVPITPANLDRPHHRRFIQQIAGQIYTKHPISIAVRGGAIKDAAFMPRGRTLKKYRDRYIESGYDEMALVAQTWLRGNRTGRISTRMRDLMTLAVEQVYLDRKMPNVSAALKRLKVLLDSENALRTVNGMAPMQVVDHSTMDAHIKKIAPTARSIARNGERATINARSRGSTDVRALMVGKEVEIDECKLSLITVAKKKGWWQRLSEGDQAALEEIEKIIRIRLWLILMIDVATRMPLAWILTDAPCAEATRAAIRMATRDKTREKTIYGCECDPMPAVGIGQQINDNGAGVRNAPVKAGCLGISTQSVDVRTYHGGDKPHVERMFGTMENCLINLIHGYTGRRAGALPGYDPIKNGVLDCAQLYGIITRYLVDEYPSERHFGTGMNGRRPINVLKQVSHDYGFCSVPADHDRRIQLGWKRKCKITDEGVKPFGLPYTSPELQILAEHVDGKVGVYVDPDDIACASIVIQGHPEPILAHLSYTRMRDLTLPQFLDIAEKARAEDPEAEADTEAHLARVRRKFYDQMQFIAIEHKLPRSYMTIAEAQKKAEVVMTGLHAPRPRTVPGTVAPNRLGQEENVPGVHKVGPGFQPAIDGRVEGDVSLAPLGKPNTEGKLS